jgi:hypothetical protein
VREVEGEDWALTGMAPSLLARKPVAPHAVAQPAPRWVPRPASATVAGLSCRRIWRGSVVLSRHSARCDQKGHVVEIKSGRNYF